MSLPSSHSIQGVAGVILRGERLLVIQRSQTVVAPGAFCFPGGAIEEGESDAAALVREIQEELGLAVRPVRRLWTSVTPWQVSLAWWLAEPIDDRSPVPNPAEVAAIHWLNPEEMAAVPNLLESNRHFLAAIQRGEVVVEGLGIGD